MFYEDAELAKMLPAECPICGFNVPLMDVEMGTVVVLADPLEGPFCCVHLHHLTGPGNPTKFAMDKVAKVVKEAMGVLHVDGREMTERDWKKQKEAKAVTRSGPAEERRKAFKNQGVRSRVDELIEAARQRSEPVPGGPKLFDQCKGSENMDPNIDPPGGES